jgi:hypothetical protein
MFQQLSSLLNKASFFALQNPIFFAFKDHSIVHLKTLRPQIFSQKANKACESIPCWVTISLCAHLHREVTVANNFSSIV